MKNNKSPSQINNNSDLVQVFCILDGICKSLGLSEIKNLKGGRSPCLNLRTCPKPSNLLKTEDNFRIFTCPI